MATSVVLRSSCSSSSMECPPLASSAESGCSNVDMLWEDVDLAERYLVCSQFEEAIASSSNLLRKLLVEWESSEQSMHNDIEDDEMESIMEAAGMVLIQANAENGRTRLIFKDLESIFGCSAKVPSSVLLTGLCLQVSAGLFMEAQLFVESYLKHWAYKELNQQFCSYKPELEHKHKFFQLSTERYMEMVNIYSVQVLAKGLGQLDLAMQWVKEADVPAEIQQDMHEKLSKLAPSECRKGETSLVSGHNMMQTTIADSSEKSEIWVTEYMETRGGIRAINEGTKQLDSYSSFKSVFLLTPLINLFSGWTMHSVPYSDCNSRWKSMSAYMSRKKLPFGGALTVFLAFAIYKQRFQLLRLFVGLDKRLQHAMHTVFISLYDFWQLAFSVQLNPLAAVQPLPSPQYRG